MQNSVVISRDDLTTLLENMVSNDRSAYIRFYRSEELNDISFKIASFNPEGGVATAISDDRRFAIQFVPEDVNRMEFTDDEANGDLKSCMFHVF